MIGHARANPVRPSKRIVNLLAAGLALAVTGAIGAPTAGHAAGGEERGSIAPVVTWSATYASRYLFQGIDYSEGRPVVQPEASAAWGPLSIGVWGNVDVTERELNELDTTVRVEWERGSVSGSVGFAYLEYPNRPEDWVASREVVADFGLEAPVAPSLSLHGDLRGGGYGMAELSRAIPAPFGFGTAALAARLYGQRDYDGKSGLSAAEGRASLAGSWKTLTWEAAASRTATWANGDFRGEGAVPASWLVALTISWSRGMGGGETE